MTTLQELPKIITAVGGLGVASFGLVDASKVFVGGVNRIGFKDIRLRISQLIPETQINALGVADVLETLRQNWFNGTDLASQKSIAKSLIKLNFNTQTAASMAAATSVDPTVLTAIAASIASGTTLTPAQTDVYARFDLILTALLDGTYQRADQKYTNGTRAWAMVVAVVLAFVGASVITNQVPWELGYSDRLEALLVGLLATPLAPIAKDISTALATAVNTMQLVKK